MKRVLATIAALMLCATAEAQIMAIGERMPSLRKATQWIDGYKPAKTEFTYVEFICSASGPCKESVRYIAEFVKRSPQVRMIILTKEGKDHLEEWVYDYAGEGSGVAIECGEVFGIFGVNYAPLGVLLDAKRRVRWLGNPKQLTHERIVKLISQTKKQAYGIH